MAAAQRASHDERVLASGMTQAAARAAAVRRSVYSGRLERGWPRSGPPRNRLRAFRQRSNQRLMNAWRPRAERGTRPRAGPLDGVRHVVRKHTDGPGSRF